MTESKKMIQLFNELKQQTDMTKYDKADQWALELVFEWLQA